MTTGVFKFSLITAILLVAVVFGAWYFLASPDEAPAMPGRISGTTSYPGEFIPAQVVCAEPVGGGPEVCGEASESDAAGLVPTWTLTVPAGQYYVSAHMKDPSEMGSDLGDYRAYYTQYVVCGSKYECKDHSKVVVSVASDRTTSDITPYDWYMK
jgi:hypothetical protein